MATMFTESTIYNQHNGSCLHDNNMVYKQFVITFTFPKSKPPNPFQMFL